MTQDLTALFNLQRDAFLKDGYPDYKTRLDRLDRMASMLIDHKQQITDALNEDFAGRPYLHSLIADVVSLLIEIKDTRKHLKQWMQPERRKAGFPMGLLGAKAEVQFQPLGVVGNISPWNFPVALALSPTIGAIAAGNRVMIKPSELTPNTSNIIAEMIAKNFAPEELAVVTGGVEVAQSFSHLPFDHLVFTGGASVAKQVMKAAAENLVPLTLELGGKCPVIVSDTADMAMVAERVMAVKVINSGQLCLTPDYVFVPAGREEEFLTEARKVMSKFMSSMLDNEQITSIINTRHWHRLQAYLDEAKQKDVRIEVFNPANEDFSDPERHRMAMHFPINPDESCQLMQDEIFGPIMSIKGYNSIPEAIHYINNKPRPLALYYFGSNNKELEDITKNTTSGGVSINDVAAHFSCHDLPLSGVGNSGMGAYHGRDGFLQFSHKKAVFKQGVISLGKLAHLPHTPSKVKMFEKMLKR